MLLCGELNLYNHEQRRTNLQYSPHALPRYRTYRGQRRLIDGIGSAAGVFSQRKELPELLPGVSPTIVTALDNPAAFLRAEHEMEFVEKNRLTCLTLKDEAYPSRLR